MKSAFWLRGIIALHFLGYAALVTDTINKSCPRDAHGSVGKVSDQSPIHIYYLLSLFLFLLSCFYFCYCGNQTATRHNELTILNKLVFISATYCPHISSVWSLLILCWLYLRSCLGLFYLLCTHGITNLIGLLFVCEGLSFALTSQVTHTLLRKSHSAC